MDLGPRTGQLLEDAATVRCVLVEELEASQERAKEGNAAAHIEETVQWTLKRVSERLQVSLEPYPEMDLPLYEEPTQ